MLIAERNSKKVKKKLPTVNILACVQKRRQKVGRWRSGAGENKSFHFKHK